MFGFSLQTGTGRIINNDDDDDDNDDNDDNDRYREELMSWAQNLHWEKTCDYHHIFIRRKEENIKYLF